MSYKKINKVQLKSSKNIHDVSSVFDSFSMNEVTKLLNYGGDS